MTTTSPNTRLLAGVQVPDTPLITSILSFVKEYYDEHTYNHVNRSWVLGALIASKTPTFVSPISTTPATFDPEILAIAALIHDLSWDCRKPRDKENFCSWDKRFEVDGANAGITVLKRHLEKLSEKAWDARRLQLVWDAVALHTTPSIANYKEPEVAMTASGIYADFVGPHFPGGVITWDEWELVIKEFPYVTENEETGRKEEFREGVVRLLSAQCEDKPQATYDSMLLSSYGEKYVKGYTLEGKKPADVLFDPILKR